MNQYRIRKPNRVARPVRCTQPANAFDRNPRIPAAAKQLPPRSRWTTDMAARSRVVGA